MLSACEYVISNELVIHDTVSVNEILPMETVHDYVDLALLKALGHDIRPNCY